MFPTLKNVDKKGNIRVWNIDVCDNIITICHGIKGMKLIETKEIITKGKNIGKKNETTPCQQAKIIAQSRYDKKVRSGYSPLENDSNNDNIIIFPMLAHDFKKHEKKVVYPVYAQPKLDGYRMIYNIKNNTPYSRTGKIYESIVDTQLHNELNIFETYDIEGLDGELISTTNNFESLGQIRKKNKKIGYDIVYIVYDIINNDIYEKRLKLLKEIFENNDFKKILLIDTCIIQNKNELKEKHSEYINKQYEGTIIRNINGLYMKNYRSYDLLKYKDFMDNEFIIIGHDYEINNDKKLIVWKCKTTNDNEFTVRPKGTVEERMSLCDIANNFYGKKLWVKFFEYTEKGIPRFPSTMRDTYTTYIREE